MLFLENNLSGLRWLYNEVETNVRSLKALGVEQDSYGTTVTSVLLTKLHHEIRLTVTRRASGEDLELDTLQTVFEEELIARDTLPIPPGTAVLFRQPLGNTRAKQRACCLLLLPTITFHR